MLIKSNARNFCVMAILGSGGSPFVRAWEEVLDIYRGI